MAKPLDKHAFERAGPRAIPDVAFVLAQDFLEFLLKINEHFIPPFLHEVVDQAFNIPRG